jgi:hypothetical protein
MFMAEGVRQKKLPEEPQIVVGVPNSIGRHRVEEPSGIPVEKASKLLKGKARE